MKKIICMAALIVAGACSSDDDNAKKDDFGGNIPADEKLLERFDFENSSLPLDFKYNEDMTVKRFSFANYYLFDFKYTGGKITQINAIGQGGSAIIEFSHDANGKISGFLINGEQQVVVYDPAANTYLFYEEGDDERNTIFLTEYGDVERFKSEYPNTDDKNYLFVYDDDPDKKGPMANTNSIHPYLAMIFPELITYMAFVGHKPVDVVSLYDGVIPCSNSYYNDGFVEKTDYIFSGSESEQTVSSGIYRYTKLED